MQTYVKISEVEYTLPAYWASPLLYGDESGLEGRESEEIQSFLAWAKGEHGGALCCVGVGEPEFRWRNDATRLGGECCVFSFHVTGRAAQ